MNLNSSVLKRAVARVLPFLLLFAWGCAVLHAQELTSQKFEQFGDVNTEAAMARLDMFALQLGQHPEARGMIVARNAEMGDPRGTFLRRAYGYLDYLVKLRGIDATRLSVVEGERRPKIEFELWTIPRNELSTISDEASAREPKVPELFDQLPIGPEGQCVGELTIELYKLEDGLRIFAAALQNHSQAKAWIVVHPRLRDTQLAAQRLMNLSRRSLIKKGIGPRRILTAVGSRHAITCGEVNLWIAPGNSLKADETAFYSDLIKEAEDSKYTMRRVEFLGNELTSDQVLRKQFVQQEGNLFSRRLLDQSLQNLNRLGVLYPVTINDVQVRVDREEKLMDLTIYIRERRRRK